MTSLLPTPEPADPVEGQPGHFEHSNWLKASVKALDAGAVHKAGDTMTGDLSVTRGAGDGHLKAGARAGGAVIFTTAAPESNTPGPLTIWATKLLLWNGAENPTDDNSAATKGYVDALRPTTQTIQNAIDWNINDLALGASRSVILNGSGMIGAPDANWWFIWHLTHVFGSNYAIQVAFKMNNGPGIMIRNRENDVWSAWKSLTLSP